MYPGGGPLSRALEEDSPGVEGLIGCFPGFIGMDLAWAQCMSQSTIDPAWVERGMCEPTERLEENVVTPREREAKTLGCQANVTAGTASFLATRCFLTQNKLQCTSIERGCIWLQDVSCEIAFFSPFSAPHRLGGSIVYQDCPLPKLGAIRSDYRHHHQAPLPIKGPPRLF